MTQKHYIDSSDDEDLYSENKDKDPDFSLNDNEESEFEEESHEEETCNYKLEITENPSEEKYYIVSESSLQRLLSVCHICCGQCIPIVEYSKGSMILTLSLPVRMVILINGSHSHHTRSCHGSICI